MKTTKTTATATTLGNKVATATTKSPKQETTTKAPVYTLRKPFDDCISDNDNATNALFDYIVSNNIHVAMAKDLCKGLFAKGNETANRLACNENLPFSIEDMASTALSAMFETWTTAIYDSTFETWGIELDDNGNPVLPDEMILSAYRAMAHEMYRQGTRVYKWLHIETEDGTMTALNNVQGLVSCIDDIESKALFEDLLTELEPIEKYVLKKSLEGYKRNEIVAKYAKAHRLSEKTATNRIKYAQRTLRAKALCKGIVPLF